MSPLLTLAISATTRSMRILLLGQTGLLGSEFLRILSARPDIDLLAPTHRELDLLNPTATHELLAGEYFDRIIDCVAYTHVDQAETERGRCKQMNVEILDMLLQHKSPIIHFSSDYVFDAPLNTAITEDYPRHPVNYYGETKKQAEELLETKDTMWWNIRTTWLFGDSGKNFISAILDKSITDPILHVVDDEIGRPTSARDLAKYVIEEFVDKEQPKGHYHLQNSGESCSWAELAEYILRRKNSSSQVRKISGSQLIRTADRPKNSILKNSKLSRSMRSWKDAVDDFISRS